MEADYQVLEFMDALAYRRWLDTHHADTKGIWIRLYKKASGVASISYAQALDEALCYGWIDGQRKRHDELSFLQKFTPRRPKSLWSKRNVEYVGRLTEAGLMTPAGLNEIQKAQADGRWSAAYDKPSDMTVPDDFLVELRKNPKAELFFESLNKTTKYAIVWRLQTAKTEETRKRRQDKIITMLAAGQQLH